MFMLNRVQRYFLFLIMQPLRIGALKIDPPLILAPMAGITGKAFRRLVRELNPGAVGLYYSEFASVEGLIRANKPTLRLIEKCDDDAKSPFCAQLFGMDPEHMAQAAKIAVDLGADIVDLNSGCPAQKVVKKGGGADLLKKPALIGKIVAAIRAAVSVPLTVKIRIGWDEKRINVLEVVKIIQENGADAVVIHGRTRVQAFKGEADWSMVREAKLSCAIPVVGNGDVINPETAAMRMRETGADGIMIGRGILRDPWIFRRTMESERGVPFEPSPKDKLAIFPRYAGLLREDGLPESAVLGKMKQIGLKLMRGRPGAAAIRTEAVRTQDMNEFYQATERYFDYEPDHRPIP
jgi:tRNA-dihydrouridine synthase B